MTDAGAAPLAARLATAGLDWILPDWDVASRVHALATTRNGGASRGEYATLNLGRRTADDAAALDFNRRRLDAFLPAPPVWLDQVHGATVAVLDRANVEAARREPPVADAAVTREAGIVCAVLTADCLPVFFADRAGGAVGVAHAGWRGLAAGVLEATVAALGAQGTPAAAIAAWLGPAIGPTAFEVGADVRDAFCRDDPGAAGCFRAARPGKWHADLCGLARRRLARAGVTRVGGGGHCTTTDAARFFSFRRAKDSGRMAAAIWLAPR